MDFFLVLCGAMDLVGIINGYLLLLSVEGCVWRFLVFLTETNSRQSGCSRKLRGRVRGIHGC
jgi:hypothetical protein